MIVNDQRPALTIVTSLCTLGFLLSLGSMGLAATSNPATGAVASAAALASAAAPSANVTLVAGAGERTYATTARTAGEFLAERGIALSPNDSLSVSPEDPIVDGMRITLRAAVPVYVRVNGRVQTVMSAAESVGELLARAHVPLDARDDVWPSLTSRPRAREIVSVDRVKSWTVRERRHIAFKVKYRTDPHLAFGTTRTIAAGRPGLSETTVRYERRGVERTERTVLASRIVRQPAPRIVVHGGARASAFERVAEQGFESAMHFAGSALHMIATAYTAGCFGCSGITASGLRAGLGVIAVDPRIIPLGTRLFVPGYGRAIAGDTGGAIVGNRIDLGMNDTHSAMSFGRRSVTVYVLR